MTQSVGVYNVCANLCRDLVLLAHIIESIHQQINLCAGDLKVAGKLDGVRRAGIERRKGRGGREEGEESRSEKEKWIGESCM